MNHVYLYNKYIYLMDQLMCSSLRNTSTQTYIRNKFIEIKFNNLQSIYTVYVIQRGLWSSEQRHNVLKITSVQTFMSFKY